MYYKLDLDEFFKDEYINLNNNEGIGAMGIITSKQIINVYNDYGLNKKDNKMYLGLSNHYEMTKKILTDIYGKYYDSYMYELISIKYWNSPYFKIIAFYLPTLLTESEYKFMESLNDYYSDIFKKYDITVCSYTFGDNIFEYGPAIELKSRMDLILDEAHDRVDKTLVRKKEEKILKI